MAAVADRQTGIIFRVSALWLQLRAAGKCNVLQALGVDSQESTY